MSPALSQASNSVSNNFRWRWDTVRWSNHPAGSRISSLFFRTCQTSISTTFPQIMHPSLDACSFSPKFRGRRKLSRFSLIDALKKLILVCDGPRFRHIKLQEVQRCTPVVLEAYAETLEALRFCLPDYSYQLNRLAWVYRRI